LYPVFHDKYQIVDALNQYFQSKVIIDYLFLVLEIDEHGSVYNKQYLIVFFMKNTKFLASISVILFFISTFTVQAETFVNSDSWSATDGLGRQTPTQNLTGPVKTGKYIGMFYWTWHTDQLADDELMNITNILKDNPEAAYNLKDTAWHGITNGGTFWWDEPLLGYYRTTDPWVLRKHAEMLADAGVDVVFFDCTNGSFTWKSSYTQLLKVWAQARLDGVKTPQIAFMLNFGPQQSSLESISELYKDVYKPGLYKDLWFMWKNKPLIMAYPEMLNGQDSKICGLKFSTTTSFTGVDACCPSWGNSIGNLTFKLYKWTTDYAGTVAQTPIADSTFVNFTDNSHIKLSFSELPAGTYFWQLSNPTETVGVWKWSNTKDPVTSYLNGSVVTDGNYESKIYYPGGSSDSLTTGTAHVAVPIVAGLEDAAAIKQFFTYRPGQPDYVSGPTRNDQWGWLENYPQHGYVKKTGGGYEQATVGVAQNASDESGGHASAINTPVSYGRSYTKAGGQNADTAAYYHGYNFQEQWSRANTINPDFIFVTGWNEWTAGLWTSWANPYAPFAFVDEYDKEKSRDIEPVKSWGTKGDVYYMQLVQNIRKFKGMLSPDSVSNVKTIDMTNIESWSDVKPEYQSYKGNTMHRNHPGQGKKLVYTNATGRNDIVSAKVARDSGFIYFYVETADNLTDKSDPKWMRLFIDIDRDKSTGWEGYDYVINRNNPGDSANIEKSTNSWNCEKMGAAAFSINGKTLVLKIKRTTLGLLNPDINLEFKWSDNMQEDGNIMDFYVNGDVAPGERFNYVYNVNWKEDEYSSLVTPELVNQKLKPSVTPNPSKNDFLVQTHYPSKDIKVYDLLGHLVDQTPFIEKTYSGSFGAKLHPGIYILTVTGYDGTKDTLKIVKE